MRRQFLYGRKKTGYCQINEDFPVTDKKILLQLSSMQNYNVVAGLDMNNLPEEYYAYSERIEGEKVWIEGKTSFVPAGVSEESGSRDTSMLHKVIYSGEDYKEKMLHPISKSLVMFYSTVEDYLNDSGKAIDETKEYDYEQLYQKFELDDEKMKDFIICCLDAFPNIEKRVYCYLPTSDREGSIWAKRLMEMIIGNVPACVVCGAGFVTYSSGFHNVSSNPIHGSVSVVFIPDTEENRMNERFERKQHYIFDFTNYQKQSKNEVGYVDAFVNFILKKIKNEDTNGIITKIFQEMNEFVTEGYAVDIKFLGAYMIHNMWNKMAEKGGSKFRRTLATAIHDMLQYEEALTHKAKEDIQKAVHEALYDNECTEEDFEWIDYIYKGGELCKDSILLFLCDTCLNYAEQYPAEQNQNILFVTNYEYADEELNDCILETLYSEKKYYSVGKRLVYESLKPLTADTKKTVQKKIDMLCSYMKTFCKEYYDFAVSVEFREEIEEVFLQCLKQSEEKSRHFTDIVDKISDISDSVYECYCPMIQRLAFYLLNDFVDGQKYRDAEEKEFLFYSGMMEQWELNYYAREYGEEDKNFVIQLFMKEERARKITRVFAGHDETKLLKELKNYHFSDAVDLCKRNARKIGYYLELFACEEQDNFECRNELYRYFYATGFADVMEEILEQISQYEDLDGFVEFCENVEENITKTELEKSSKIISKVLKRYPGMWKKKKNLSQKNEVFLKKHDITVVSWLDDIKKETDAVYDDDDAVSLGIWDKKAARRKKNSDAIADKDVTFEKPKRKERLSAEDRHMRDEDAPFDESDSETTKKKNPFGFFGSSKRK